MNTMKLYLAISLYGLESRFSTSGKRDVEAMDIDPYLPKAVEEVGHIPPVDNTLKIHYCANGNVASLGVGVRGGFIWLTAERHDV